MKKMYIILIMILLASSSFAQVVEQPLQGSEQFGSDVAIYGDWAVVGNKWHTEWLAGIEYSGVGMISIYKKTPVGVWEHHQNIVEGDYIYLSPGSQAGSEYGFSVDIFSDWIIVGAPHYDSDMQGNIGPDGMAFVYKLNPITGFWEIASELKPEVAVLNSAGCSVSISANWAVIGDYTESHPLLAGGNDVYNIGCAHVYERVGSDWVYHSKLTASDGWGAAMEGPGMGPGDSFGGAVDVYSNTIAVGAHKQGVQNGITDYEGKVYLYEWDGANWNETWISPPQSELMDHFGASVSLFGGRLTVGAPYADNDGSDQGAVYYYDNFSGNWSAGQKITASNAQNGALFGFDVDLYSGDLTVGSPHFDGAEEGEGRVYLYNCSDNFSEINFKASNTDFNDLFGFRVARSNSDLAVSAWLTDNNDGGETNDGTVYIFQMDEPYDGGWTGNEDDDWNNPDNWLDGNVPNAITDVVINVAKNNHPKIDNGTAICRSITIQDGATLTIEANGVFDVTGNLICTGSIVNNASQSSFKIVGETVFNGAGRQDIPGGIYQDFTFSAGDDSYMTGDVTFNGNYDHDTFDDLDVGANTLTVGGFLWGNDNRINFSAQSSLTIINDRVIDLYLPSSIYNLYDFTIDVPGNHHVAMKGTIEVHNQLNLIDGDLYIGYDHLGATLELHNPINIVSGRLVPHKLGGDSELYIHDNEKSKDVFHVPAELTTLTQFYISRSGSTVLDGDLHIESLFLLASAGFDVNGHQITYGEDAELWIFDDAEITAEMVTGPDGIQDLSISSGSPTLDFDGEVQGDFSIDAGAGEVQIAAGRCITVTGTTTIGASLVLKSDASGTACFIDNGPISYGGKADAGISVEKYIPSKDEWHYISTPVKNSTAQFFAGTYLNSYDTDNSSWVAFTSLNQAVNTMQGYSNKIPSSNSGQTITFSGELNTARTSAVSISLTNNGDGYNLVGNPFPSTIDWDNANWTKTNVANAIYTWNPGTGSYASYVAGAGVNGGTRYIAAMQGFFVEATGVNPSLTIDNNSVRVENAAAFLKSEEEINDELRISLISDSGNDEIIIRFKEEATAIFDAAFDANKMFGNNDLAQIYSKSTDGTQMAIHTLKSVKETEFVKLGLKIEESGIYNLQFIDNESFTENVTITLEDLKTGTLFVLSSNDTYEFNYEVGDLEDRFILHFKDVTGINSMKNKEVFAYIVNNQLYVNMNDENKTESIQIFNINGQLVNSQPVFNEPIMSINMGGLARGSYIIKLTSETDIITQKVVY